MINKFNGEELVSLEEVESQIGKIFDILNSEIFSSDDYYIILFLLSAYKDGLISNDTIDSKKLLNGKLKDALYNSDNLSINQYVKIYNSFLPSIKRLSEKVLSNILNMLFEINKQVLTVNFPNFFNNVLHRILKTQGRFSGEFIQPVELTTFMCGLVDMKNDAKVYNPFAGLASFGVNFEKDIKYFAQEINYKTWAIGALRLMAYNKLSFSNYVCDDSILHWPTQNEKYDLIISQPPLGFRLNGEFESQFGKIRKVEQFLIEKGLESLNYDGKLIICLSHNFLFSNSHLDRNMRQYLIENDLLDLVISFPGGILMNTSNIIDIVVISKRKKDKGYVRFIETNNFIEKNSKRDIKIDFDNLLSSINGLINEDCVHLVRNEIIIENDFNLNPPRYFLNANVGITLGELGFIIRGEKINDELHGKFVRTRDLRDNNFEYQLDLNLIENNQIPKYAVKIDESCLLLSVRWKTLKPTFFKYNGSPIYISNDIVAFKPNDSIIHVGFLVNELYSDYATKQLDAYRLGGYVLNIRREDLISVKIEIPDYHYKHLFAESLEEQLFIINKINEGKRAEMINQIGLEVELHRLIIEQKNDLSIKKHNIMQHLNNVRESAKTLYEIMNKNKGILDATQVINPNTGSTVEKRFKRLIESINESLFFVDNITNELGLDEKQEYNMCDLIKEAIDKGQLNPDLFSVDFFFDKHSFQILANTAEDEELMDLDPLAEVSKKDFFEVYNNIIENAIRNGFTKLGKKYIFRIEILGGGIYRSEGSFITINFLNNGNPFPEGMAERYCIKGEKAGPGGNFGIGGWKVFEIVQNHFKGKVIVHDLKGEDFPVKIEIQLPCSNIKSI